MKKILILLLALTMLLTLASCDQGDIPDPPDGPDVQNGNDNGNANGGNGNSGNNGDTAFNSIFLSSLGLSDIAPNGATKKEVKHEWESLNQGEYNFYSPVGNDADIDRMEYANKVLKAINAASDDGKAYRDVFTAEIQGWIIAEPFSSGISSMPSYYFYKNGSVFSLVIQEEGDSREHHYNIFVQKEEDGYIKYSGSTSEDNSGSIPEIDLGAIISGSGTTDIIYSELDETTKAQLIAEAKKDGVDLSFGSDGSMTVVDPDSGETVVQRPDGTWAVKGSDGSEGQLGGNWPENEFTKLLPKPDFDLLAATTTEDTFSVGFQNVTVSQIRDYVEKVKAKGFTVDPELTDQEMMGMVIYNYTAKNSSGYTVNVAFTAGISSILLEKP